MKSSVDGNPDGRVGLQLCNREGSEFRRLGGVCGVEIGSVLNGDGRDVLVPLRELCGAGMPDRLVISSKKVGMKSYPLNGRLLQASLQNSPPPSLVGSYCSRIIPQ